MYWLQLLKRKFVSDKQGIDSFCKFWPKGWTRYHGTILPSAIPHTFAIGSLWELDWLTQINDTINGYMPVSLFVKFVKYLKYCNIYVLQKKSFHSWWVSLIESDIFIKKCLIFFHSNLRLSKNVVLGPVTAIIKNPAYRITTKPPEGAGTIQTFVYQHIWS